MTVRNAKDTVIGILILKDLKKKGFTTHQQYLDAVAKLQVEGKITEAHAAEAKRQIDYQLEKGVLFRLNT